MPTKKAPAKNKKPTAAAPKKTTRAILPNATDGGNGGLGKTEHSTKGLKPAKKKR